MRYLFAGAVAMAVSALTFPTTALAQGGTSGLSISPTGYIEISETRVDRNDYYYTYIAALNNTGGALTGVTATITSLASNVTVVAGQGTLQFSPVPAGSSASPIQVTSSNTFTLLINRTVPFNWSQVSWSFNNPYADPGPNQTVPVQSNVSLNGSGSTNPGGIGSLTYTWAIQSAPSGSQASLTNANNMMASFVPDLVGNYLIALTVSNGSQSDTNTVTISTTDIPPTAIAGPNQTVSANTVVNLSGASSTDANGKPLSYQWSFVSKPNNSGAVLLNAQSPTPSFTADVPLGTWIVGLVVNDGTLSSLSLPASMVTITTGDTAPVAVATATPQMVNVNGLVQLDGSKSTDVDGNSLTYVWSLNLSQAPGSKAKLSAANIVNPTFTADVQGTYVAQLIVNDGILNSTAVTVTISTNAVIAPTAIAGAPQTSLLVGSIVQLQGSGTDPQNLPLTYTWTLPTFPAGSNAPSSFPTNTQNPTFVADLPGTYGAQLVVNNGYVNSAPVAVQITSNWTPPVAVPTTTTPSVTTGTTVTLSGSSSYDPNNDPITKYAWSLSVPPGSTTAALTGANTVSPTFVPDVAGTYVAQLIVSDAYGPGLPVTVSISAGQMTITLTPNPLDLSSQALPLTVTLSPGAGASPINVTLSGYDNTVISVPSNTVTIPANSSSANVTVTPLNTGNTTISANATNYEPGNTSVVVATPTISVTFANNATSVGLGHSIVGTITLSAPAPQPTGTSVTLQDIQDHDSGGQPGLVTFNPSTVVIPAGSSTGTFTMTGTEVGGIEILPAVAGYARVNFIVSNVVILGNVVVPNNAVAEGQTVPLNVQLSAAAPSDGATVTLQSGNTGVLTINPTTLTFNPGSTTPTVTPQVTGVALGTTTITGSEPGYNTDTVSVNVTSTLSLSPANVSVTVGGQQTINVTLSGAAPASGVPVTLSSSTGNATVTTSVTIPGGQTSATAQINGVSTGTATVTATTNNPLISTAGASVAVTVGTISLPCPATTTGEVGVAFSSQLSATGGVSPYTYAIASGSLPASLSLNPSTGLISGTPTGTGSFTVKVTDSTGASTTSCTFTINAALALPCPATTTGEQGVAFTSQLSATGGVGTYTYSLATGSLLGLTLNPSTGLISGTPTGNGTFTIKVTDSNGSSVTSCTFTINAALALPCPATTTGEQGVAFTSQLSATGGVGTYTYSLATGSLLGLTLNPSTGAITGTPTGNGTFTIKVTDSNGASVTSCTFTINAALALPCPATTTGEQGAAFTSQLSATGGVGTYTYALASGSLLGLTLNPSTGAITGTPTGTGTFTIKVTDAKGASVTSCTFTISAALALPCPATTTGEQGVAFTSQLSATGGVGTYTYSLATGSLLGLTLNPSTGLISGTPTGNGTFTIKVTDSNGSSVTSCTFTISAALALPCPATTTGEQGVAFTSQLSATGGVGTYTYSLATGSLLGLTLNPSTGAITGTPTGTGTFTIKVTDSNGASVTSCTFTINSALALPCPATTTGEQGVAFTSQLSATGGVGTYTYSLATGSLLGLTLNPSTGAITGTPTGNGTFTIKVTDSNGASVTSCTFTINAALALPCPATTTGEQGVAFTSQLSATGGVGTYTYSLATGSLLGLTLNPSTGAITGTPTGNGTFTIKVTDSNGASVTSCTFTINAALALPCPATTTGEQGAAFTSQLSATGGVGTYTYALASGSLLGLTLNPSTGAITGTPTGTGTFTIKVTDAKGASVTSCTFTISAALALPCPATTTGEQGVAFTSQLSATGGVGTYTYSLATGSLLGLTLNPSTGAITGTPTGNGTFTIKVTDSNGSSVTSCTFTINAALALPCPATTTGEQGVAFTSQLSATGGVGTYTYSLASGSLLGLTLNPSTGAITGTPTGTGTFTIKVTDSLGASATSCTFTINAALALPCPTTTTGTQNSPFSSQLSATGGVGTYTYSVVGTLPANLTLNQSTGLVSGTPTTSGTFTIKVTDSLGASVTSCMFTISAPVALSITTTSPLPAGTSGVAYTTTISANGGKGPYNWSLSTPSWLTINSSTGVISGTPNRGTGIFYVSVTVTDSSSTQQTASMTFMLTINPNTLMFTTTSLPNATQGQFYSQPIVVTGGFTPYQWQTSTLPTWLTFDYTGAACSTNVPTLCGTPPSFGTATFSIAVTDASSVQVTQLYTLTINTQNGTTPTMTIVGGSGNTSNFSVGQNLQVPVTLTFNPAPNGNATVTLTSSTPGAITFTSTPVYNGTTNSIPANSLQVTSDGGSSFLFYVQGAASSGTITITATSSGYVNGTATVTLANSGFVIQGPNGIGSSFTTYEGVVTGLTVGAARLDNNNLFVEYEQVANGQTCTAPLMVAASSLGGVSPSAASFSASISTVPVNFTASSVNSGTGTVSLLFQPSCASGTPATGTSLGVTVQADGYATPATPMIGNDLQIQTNLSLAAASPSAATLTLQSNSPSTLALWCTETGLTTEQGCNQVNSGEIILTIPQGQTSTPNFWMRGYASSGSASYTISSSNYGTITANVNFGPSALVIQTPKGNDANFSMSVSTSNATLTILTALDNNGALTTQEVAADQSVSVNVTASSGTPTVGSISSSPITIPGATPGGVTTTFVPSALGSASISATSTTGFQPSGSPILAAGVTATVTNCNLFVGNQITVGQYLEAMGTVFSSCLGATGGTPITLTSNSPYLQLAVNATAPGSSSIVVTLPQNGNSATFWVYGMGTGLATGEGASPATVTYTASSSGFTSSTDTVTLAPSGILILGPNDALGGFSASASTGGPQTLNIFTDYLSTDGNDTPNGNGIQPLAGNVALVVALTNGNPGAGTLSSPTATINPGTSGGTVTFTPTAVGNSTVSVTQPAGWIGNVGLYNGSYNLTQLAITVTP